VTEGVVFFIQGLLRARSWTTREWTNEHTQECFGTIEELLDDDPNDDDEAKDLFHLLAVAVWITKQLPAVSNTMHNERCYAWATAVTLLLGIVHGLGVEKMFETDDTGEKSNNLQS
jgi:hypothetical protein